MTGTGLQGIALLAENDYELRHPMFARLKHRAGVKDDAFYFGTINEPGLLESLQRRKVRVIVPLGERALQKTIEQSDILRWRGRTVSHRHLPDVHVVPMFAASKLMSRHSDDDEDAMRHPPRFHGIWMRDLHHALWVAQNGFSRLPVTYLVDPTPQIFAQFADEYEAQLVADSDTGLSWDIETFYKMSKQSEDDFEEENANVNIGDILRISFAFREGYAVSVPWSPSYYPTIRRLLASRGRHIVWNGSTFDVPVVQAVGFDVLGVVEDHMDAYHLLQSDLPKGLEWVSSEASDLLPWKHLAQAEPGWYSCTDADSGLRNANYNRRELIKQHQWPLFQAHVVRLMPILVQAGKHGNLMDVEKREEIRSKLIAMREALVAEIQQFVPRELFPRTRYERQPEGVEGDYPKQFEPRQLQQLAGWDVLYEPSDEKVCSVCGQFASNKSEHFKGSVGPVNPKSGKPTRIKNPCKEAGATIDSRAAFAPRFLRLEPWNPNSSDQLKAYMRHFGHPLGKDKRDSKKETADANHLKFLHKAYGVKFPLYSKSLVVHKVSKTIGTYTPEPDSNNLIHTQYVNSTSTWRLGSRKVLHGTQIQNWGKRKDDVPTVTAEEQAAMKLSQEARKQIIARPRHKLVQIDSSAVEAVMQGYFMNDPDYMRLASKSIHAWLCCRALGWEFTPENVEKVKKLHAGLYSKMKVTNYLTNFGGGPRLMHDTYPEDFPSVKVAQDTQDSLYALLPTLKAYHHATRWEAHTKTYLESPWGYRHWFYDVFKRKPDGTLALSKDSKRSVAFKPQNSNGGFQKDNILLTAVSPIDGPAILDLDYVDANWDVLDRAIRRGETWARYMPTNVSIHDSECLDCPDEHVEHASESLLDIFTRPIPQMRGLQVGAEVEVGLNWAEMEGVAKRVMDNYTFANTEAGVDPGLQRAA